MKVIELSSRINKTWKLCFIGSLLGCLVLVLYFNPNGKTVISFSAAINTVQQFPLYNESEPPISTSHSNPPAQEFRTEPPMLSSIAKPPVQQFISPGQSEAPMSSLRAKPPVHEFIFHGQSEKTMSLISANPPVQEISLGDQSEAPIPSMMNKTANFTYFTPNIPMNDAKKSTYTKCNMFEGRWVYKPEEKPIYDSSNCPFIEDKTSCQKNGRPDDDYQKWRWEAKDCDIPLFNGRDMLERLRNKRVIIVGDSINRNMWESLSCLLYFSIPSSRAEVHTKQPQRLLKAKDYNAVIEFHWSPFLVEYDANHKSGKKVLVLDRLSRNSKLWRGADVMIFNSAHWWNHRGKMQNWDLLQYKGQLLPEGMPIEQAYEIGLKTWAKWIKNNVDPKKTVVFFRSVSAQHGGRPNCYYVKTPLNYDSPDKKNKFPKALIDITKSVVQGMHKPRVTYLDITKLSEYRKDAHPSVFTNSLGKIYATKYKRLIRSLSDCSHWCLPGVPDTWNHMLYAMLTWNMSN